MTEEIQQMFVALNNQLIDLADLIRKVNDRQEIVLRKIEKLCDPKTFDELYQQYHQK